MHYTCIHEFMHTCTHTYMHACVHAYLQTVFASWELGIEKAVDRPRLSPVGWCRGLFVNDAKMFTENRQIKVTWWLTYLWLEISRWFNLHPLTISQNRMCLQSGIHSPTIWWFQGWVPWSDGRTPRLKSWSLPPRCKKKRVLHCP